MSGHDTRPSIAGRITNDRSTLAATIGWLNVMTMAELTGALLLEGSTDSTYGATRADPFQGRGTCAGTGNGAPASAAGGVPTGFGFLLHWSCPGGTTAWANTAVTRWSCVAAPAITAKRRTQAR